MPELPEVETVKNTLKNLVVGQVINDVEILYEGVVKTAYDEFIKIKNQRINDILRVGKYLIFQLDDVYLVSHLRMEGKYFVDNLDHEIRKHDLVIFHLDNKNLVYNDTRRFGTLDVVKDYKNFEKISKLGPEPFDITFEDLKTSLSRKSIAIKTALLDQTVMAGLGNIYVDEVLFLCKLNPTMKCNTLDDKQIMQIIDASIITLNKAIKLGGTTIRSYTSSEGVHGLFQNELLVHTKQGELCPNCQSIIEKTKVNGRGTYYCPRCQK